MDAASRAAMRGQARLILLATDLSPRSAARAREVFGEVPVVRPATKDAIGRALGRRQTGVVAITDTGFALSLKDQWATTMMEVTEKSDASV